MSSKRLFESVVKAVENMMAASHRHHVKQLQKKQKALVAYQKMNALKVGKLWNSEEEGKVMDDIAKQLGMHIIPVVDTKMLSHLDKKDSQFTGSESNHVSTIAVFLNSQTEYCDLLERYNPGISQQQTDKVRRTARRVGLEVPE